MQHRTLFDQDGHQWIVWGRDPSKPSTIIDTNEYCIINNGRGMLLDPGGTEVFPAVLTEVSKLIDMSCIDAYLCSHQDPDVMSSLPLWMALTPQAKIYMSWLWTGFVAHFGEAFASSFIPVEDGGMKVELGSADLQLVPAHYCHASGNFHLFDPKARLFFSGDMGAALVPHDYPLIVTDINDHIQFMEGFHVRWLPSNEAKNRWVRTVRRLKPEMICPQHGSIFSGPAVDQFLDWIESLEVGRTRV